MRPVGAGPLWRGLLAAAVAAATACAVLAVVALSGAPDGPDPFVSREVATLAPTVDVGPDGVPLANGIVVPSLERQPDRPRVDLAGRWRSERFAADPALSLTDRAVALPAVEAAAGGRHQPGYDDSGWARHAVPSPENTLGGEPEDYQGGVWYRRTVDAPPAGPGTRVRLVFGSVAAIADVWVNGRWVGYHEGAYSPFVFDVTDALAAGPTTIAVRVDNPPLGTRTDTVPAQVVDWVNYTGIIGGVHLEYVPADGIARVDAVPRALDGVDPRERIALDVTVVTAATDAVALRLAHAVVTPETIGTDRPADLAGAEQPVTETGREVARGPGRTVVRITLEITDPALWSPDDPRLHVLTATVPGDAYATQVGLRTVGVARDSPTVLLNGRAARFAGLNRHEEWPDSGRTVTDPQRVVDDLRAVRATGATLLRTAHYPNDPLTYLVADRLGLAVIEEIPVWWADAYAFADQERRGIARQMWREMVFRDRNRASVIAWSAVNEGRAPHARAAHLNGLVRDLRRGYPDGRLVTQSAAADRPGPDDPSRHQVDVAGYTLYPGTFDDASPADAGRRAAEFLRAVRAAAPDQPYWVTEFGMYAGRDGALAGRQAELFSAVWAALRADPDLTGAAWWAVEDGFTPVAGVNTFGLRRLSPGAGRSGAERPVAARLTAAYRATGPVTGGPWLPARPVFVPGPLPAPEHGPVPPGTLSDLAAPDPAEPAGDAVLTAADGALALHPTGPEPSAAVYLYGRPVDLTAADRLCLTVTDPGGGTQLRLTLRDTAGATAAVDATGTAAATPTRLCAPLAGAGVDLARVDLVTVTLRGSAGGDLVVDDLTAVTK